jgi:Arc/MetJ-type ribon-helix-helix transcriptional regulator
MASSLIGGRIDLLPAQREHKIEVYRGPLALPRVCPMVFLWGIRNMDLNLPAETIRLVEVLVASGEYSTAQDAVADGVRLLMTRKQLRDDIQKETTELDAGQWIDGKEVFS